MQRNMSSTDRIIRFIIAVVIGILYFTGVISGWVAIVLGIVGLAFLVTAIIGWCPIYAILHMSTLRHERG